ncbi:MAG: HAD-IA family hydrolase [Cyanothece sp. SIO2G6]|nr:HAD-IA family hydrolase [Cyanothece sp. SIO2G6]
MVSVVIFDFDGTIADTLEPLLAIANQLAAEFHYSPITVNELKQLQQLDTREIIRQSNIPLLKIPFLLRRIKTELNQQIAEVQPIEWIPEALSALKEHHHSLGIVTSNSEENVAAFLASHHLTPLFDFIKSGTTIFGKHRVIRRLLNQRKISLDTAIYVGDETRDIESAKAINMRIIAVSWGFNDYDVLEQYQPDQLIEQPQALLAAVENLGLLCE